MLRLQILRICRYSMVAADFQLLILCTYVIYGYVWYITFLSCLDFFV